MAKQLAKFGIKALKPQLVAGSWQKPKISARVAADLKKQFLLEGRWVWMYGAWMQLQCSPNMKCAALWIYCEYQRKERTQFKIEGHKFNLNSGCSTVTPDIHANAVASTRSNSISGSGTNSNWTVVQNCINVNSQFHTLICKFKFKFRFRFRFRFSRFKFRDNCGQRN